MKRTLMTYTSLMTYTRLIALALLASLMLAHSAVAQTAPAGNETTREPAAISDGMTNPYAAMTPGTPITTEAKTKFAADVDLSPLRDLAVFHNGRVKILDTLAKETVSSITGKAKYFDYLLSEGGEKALRKRFDPLFTMLDLIIDPAYYQSRPLIGVDFLPLREAFLKRLFTGDAEIEWWKRDGRLKPDDIDRVRESVLQQDSMNPGFGVAIERMEFGRQLYANAWRYLLMVAPPTSDDRWQHVQQLPVDSPAKLAMAELASAWQAGDAPRVNAAAKSLAAELPRVNAALYPTTQRSMERLYNKANAFEWGFWVYALALLTLLLAFGTGRRTLVAVGVALLFGALSLHAFGFVARCIIAERFAIQNQFESMTGLSLFAVTIGSAIMLIRRQWLFGAAAAGVGFMVLVTATQTGIPGVNVEREAPILNTSVLLKYHVTIVLLSYGLISLGFIVSLFYLVTHYASRLKAGVSDRAVLGGGSGGAVELSAAALGLEDDAAKGTGRVLGDLDKAQMIMLQLAFWGLGVGILLGAWWADHSWGRWWAFDPKELWALVTWIVYLIVIHLRFTTGKNRALITAWLSIVGFVVMLWTYFGVNLLLPGLHAYA